MSAQVHGTLCWEAPYRDAQTATILYNAALARGRRGQLCSGLTGRPRVLFSLEEVSELCSVQIQSSDRVRTVEIACICGSENRVADFDRDFNPLQMHTQARWLSIAAAMQRGRFLPPVALIQVGERYFVRDGHHRISVARALGQKAIEATVEIWHVDQPLPWDEQSQAPSPGRARSHADPRTPAGGSRPASILDWLSSMLRPAEPARANGGAG